MLKPGDPAPNFDLPAAHNDRVERVSLAKISSELILIFFYPRDFSFICPTEVTGFNHARDQFRAENTALLGASVDDADSHLRWARELGGIGFPLLADQDGKLARGFGVFDETEQVALRATFILDRQRKVAFSLACPLNVGRSVGEMVRLVSALRCNRLCPADWTPGVQFGPSDRKF